MYYNLNGSLDEIIPKQHYYTFDCWDNEILWEITYLAFIKLEDLMFKVNIALVAVLILAVFIPVAAAHDSASEAGVNVNQGRGDYAHVTGKLIIHNITVEEVYDYVVDIENEAEWYPGVLSSVLISGDGGRGTVYEQQFFFAGQIFTFNVIINQTVDDKLIILTTDGLLANETRYQFKQLGDGSVEFTVDAFVQAPAGFPPEDIQAFLTFSLFNLLGALGTTGEVIIPAHGSQPL